MAIVNMFPAGGGISIPDDAWPIAFINGSYGTTINSYFKIGTDKLEIVPGSNTTSSSNVTTINNNLKNMTFRPSKSFCGMTPGELYHFGISQFTASGSVYSGTLYIYSESNTEVWSKNITISGSMSIPFSKP